MQNRHGNDLEMSLFDELPYGLRSLLNLSPIETVISVPEIYNMHFVRKITTPQIIIKYRKIQEELQLKAKESEPWINPGDNGVRSPRDKKEYRNVRSSRH